MLWIIILSLAFSSAIAVYKFRFSTKMTLYNLHITQFYYLFFLIPIIAISLFNIVFDILSHPAAHPANFGMTKISLLIFSLYSILLGVVGVAIHATSTTLHDLFEDKKHKVYLLNNFYHGPLSHNMLYLGGILTAFSFIIAESNFPTRYSVHPIFLFSCGVILGVTQSIGIIWSTYYKPSFAVALVTTLFSSFIIFTTPSLENYPYMIVCFINLSTISLLLSLYTCASHKSLIKLKKVFHKYLFPHGHPHKVLSTE